MCPWSNMFVVCTVNVTILLFVAWTIVLPRMECQKQDNRTIFWTVHLFSTKTLVLYCYRWVTQTKSWKIVKWFLDFKKKWKENKLDWLCRSCGIADPYVVAMLRIRKEKSMSRQWCLGNLVNHMWKSMK